MSYPRRPLPSQKELQEYFDYKPESGDVYWKISPSRTVKAGSLVGHKSTVGYIVVGLNNKSYLLHRLIWVLHYGQDPGQYVIDHIDNDPTNNKISNLSVVTDKGNARNRRISKANTSGVQGVSYHKGRNKWHASITKQGQHLHLGSFDNLKEAAAARKQAEIKLYSACQFELILN